MAREVRRSIRRIAVTLAAILITAGMVTALFDEARAIGVQVDDPDTASILTTTDQIKVPVTITVPEDQRLPIQSVKAILESTPTPTKTDAVRVDSATCTTPIPDGCVNTTSEVITEISFGGSTPGLDDHGYGDCGGYCFVEHPGYGYTPLHGYGYLIDDLVGEGYELVDGDHGYGYANGELQLSFEITISPANLNASGHYWLTFQAHTGSQILGSIQGPAKHLQIFEGQVSGTIDQVFDAKKNQVVEVDVQEDDETTKGVKQVNVTFKEDCPGCRLVVETFDDSPAPETTPDLPDGKTPVRFLTLEIQDGDGNVVDDKVQTGTIDFQLDQADLDGLPGITDPGDVVLFRLSSGQWQALDTDLLTDPDADPVVYRATLPGFSTFAIGTTVTPTGGGGGSSGSSGGGGGGGQADDVLTSNAQGVIPADVGQLFDAGPGDQVQIGAGLPDRITELHIDLDEVCPACKLEVALTDQAPDGLPEAGFDGLYPFSLDLVSADGQDRSTAISGGTITFQVPAEAVSEPTTADQVVLVRHADDAWTPLVTELQTTADADPLVYEATLPGFSDFSVALDTRPPSIVDAEPTGVVHDLTPTLTATALDNRFLDRGSITLSIDGETHDGGTGELTLLPEGQVSQGTISYTPDQPLLLGSHTASLTIADTSGLTATETWAFEVDCPTELPIQRISPAPDAFINASSPTLEVVYAGLDGQCPVDTATTTLALDGQQVTPSFGTDAVTYQATDLSEGTHEATVVLVSPEGGTTEQAWSFTVDLTPPTLTSLAPSDTEVETARPSIEATFEDDLSQVLPEAVTLVLDGQDVTDQADITPTSLTYTPTEDLADGEHTVELTLQDRAGNAQTYESSFETSTGPPGLMFVMILVVVGIIGAVAIYYVRSPRFGE